MPRKLTPSAQRDLFALPPAGPASASAVTAPVDPGCGECTPLVCTACTTPRPDCIGMLVEGIGNRCGALAGVVVD